MYTIKKSLGQHFLHDENVCKRIIAALQQNDFRNLLEVGPGAGAITKYLLRLEDINLKAIEIDHEKVVYLKQQFPAIENKIIEADILRASLPFQDSFTVVGNFPYNISSQILFKILEWKDQVDTVVGMFQKEVAERVASASGTKVYGVTSVLIQTFFSVEYLFEISEGAFTPPPKVKSAVIRLTMRKTKPEIQSESALFAVVKTAFNQRRKMLRNSVKSLFEPDILQDGIFSKRPEQLTVADFAALTFKMKNLTGKKHEMPADENV